MKALKVNLHLQDEASEDCGPISSLMILDYFNITDSREEVLAKIPRCDFGTSAFDNAQVLKNYGLNVEIITAHPKVFDGDFLSKEPSTEQILDRIEDIKQKEKSVNSRQILEGLKKFIKDDGKLTLAIPVEESIKQALDENRLIFAGMYTKALGANEGGYHFVVIGGYKEDKFLIYNPWPPSRQKSWEPIDKVMFAIHCSTLFDYDNGAILVVGKNNTT